MSLIFRAPRGVTRDVMEGLLRGLALEPGGKGPGWSRGRVWDSRVPWPPERQGQRHQRPLLPCCAVTSLHISTLIRERRAAPCTLYVCEGNRTPGTRFMAPGLTQQHVTREVKASLWRRAWRPGCGLGAFEGPGAQRDTVTSKFQGVHSGQEGEWLGRGRAGELRQRSQQWLRAG